MIGSTALVVEDDPKSQKLVCALLELRGFRVFCANTADQACALAREHAPDVILMDIQLSGADGVSALSALRENASTAAIPVIAMTAFAMDGDRERFLGYGFTGYVSKPIDARSFVDVVTSYLPAQG